MSKSQFFKWDAIQQSTNGLLNLYRSGSSNSFHMNEKCIQISTSRSRARNAFGIVVKSSDDGGYFASKRIIKCSNVDFLNVPMFVMYRSYRVDFDRKNIISVKPKEHDFAEESYSVQLEIDDCLDEDNLFSTQLLYPKFTAHYAKTLAVFVPTIHALNRAREQILTEEAINKFKHRIQFMK